MLKLLNKYGLFGFIYNGLNYMKTKILYPEARFIRFPFECRNRKSISLGTNLTTGINCRIEATISDSEKRIILGDNVQINDFVHITGHKYVSIGNNVLIASKVYISDCTHGSYNGKNQSSPKSVPESRKLTQNDVVIEDNVWLGDNVCILPGAHIGFGSIIGANSTVIGFIPSNCIAVGSPAKVIKIYDSKLKQWVKKSNKN